MMMTLAVGFPSKSDALGSGTDVKKSIRGWTKCDGTADDSDGVARAFAAARHAAFTLVVDCPVRLKIGMDIARPIFVDDGTTVVFTGTGKFFVDNVFIPAFVIADSNDVTFADWNVEYDASLPVNPKVGGYVKNGQQLNGSLPPNAFNDLALTPWLAANRGIVFDKSQGNVNAKWNTATNSCAVFFLTGDTSNVRVTGMKLYVPKGANGERFIPVAFSLTPNVKRNAKVTATSPFSAQYFAVPHDLTFANIELDGTYMGWVGGIRNAVFENIRSHRYGDLQDAQGGTIGGVGKWFAPPHLFYFSYVPTGDPELFNKNVQIKNVVDDGPRVGTPRDKGGSDSVSGYALSLKLGCVDCSVDTYTTTRPDGFMDVLAADNMTVSNVNATYDSNFLNDTFPGWRFPSSPYHNLRFENIVLKDSAPISLRKPIGDAGNQANQNIVFKNVRAEFNQWKGPEASPLPAIAGQGTDAGLTYSIKGDRSEMAKAQKGTAELTLKISSDAGSTVATWDSKQTSNCVASGAWSGMLPAQGTQTLGASVADGSELVLTCQSAAGALTTTLKLVRP